MKAAYIFLTLTLSGPAYAQHLPGNHALDPHYLDSCERSKVQLKAVQQVLATNGGRPLAKTSALLNQSIEECFTQPRDIKLSDEEVQQTRGSGGMVGIVRTGLARSRLGQEKMQARQQRCTKDQAAIQQAIKDDREDLNDHLNERRAGLKHFEEYALKTNMPASEQQPHLELFHKQIREAELDLSKTGQVSSYARDAYQGVVGCYARLKSVYDKAAADYEDGLAKVSAEETVMASNAPKVTPPTPIRNMTTDELKNLSADQLKNLARDQAISKPIEQGLTQTARLAGRALATEVPKAALKRVTGAVSDIVIPSENPGGACLYAPLDDPWKRYTFGCFRANSVGSAIDILKRP